MAVTWLRETGEDRESSTDDKGVKSATRIFLAITNSMLDGGRTVEAAWGLPRVNVPYIEANGGIDATMRCKQYHCAFSARLQCPQCENPGKTAFLPAKWLKNAALGRRPQSHQASQVPKPSALATTKKRNGIGCKKVQASATDLWWKWKITCSYDSAPRDSKNKEKQEPNPVLRPPRFSFGCKKQRVALERDALDRPIVNKAGDPFDPPIEQERALLTMTVEKNFAIFNPLIINTYVQSVNADLFLGWPAKTVVVDDIDAQEKEENDYTFWGVKYVFLFAIHGETWELDVLNQGKRERLPDGTRRVITDPKSKQAITKPVLLNVDGAATDAFGDDAPTANYVTFDVHPILPFGGLGLG